MLKNTPVLPSFPKKETLKNDFENPSGLSLILADSLLHSLYIDPASSRFSCQLSATPERQLAHTSAHLPSSRASHCTSCLLRQWSQRFFCALGDSGNFENWRDPCLPSGEKAGEAQEGGSHRVREEGSPKRVSKSFFEVFF